VTLAEERPEQLLQAVILGILYEGTKYHRGSTRRAVRPTL